MNASTNITKKGASPVVGGSKARVSAKARAAIGYLVKLGCTQEEAAKLADMNASALSRALAKPHVKAALIAAQQQRIKDINNARPLYKALAWERAHEIAMNSKDEKNSLKAVELLTGEGRAGPSVAVTVNAGGGYEFVRPGQRLVEIEGTSPDQVSSDGGPEDAEIIED